MLLSLCLLSIETTLARLELVVGVVVVLKYLRGKTVTDDCHGGVRGEEHDFTAIVRFVLGLFLLVGVQIATDPTSSVGVCCNIGMSL